MGTHADGAHGVIAFGREDHEPSILHIGQARCEANSLSEHIGDIETLMNVSGFTPHDMEHIHHLSEYIVPRLPALADRFYEHLLANEHVHPYLEAHIDQLKNTHVAWLADFFSGDYGFIVRQRRIGELYVAAGIPPFFVAASMSFLRGAFLGEIEIAAKSADKPSGKYAVAVLRLLALCQYLIDSAYEAERMMRRLTIAAGMSASVASNGTSGNSHHMEEIKIIIAGPVGAGKTTAMRTVFGDNLLAGEAKYMAVEVGDGKRYTTVSMDYGTLNDMHNCSERPVKLHVYSIPWQEKFKFMWEILSKNANGLIILVAAGEQNIFSVISNYLSVMWPYMHNDKAVLVALNKIPEDFIENINMPEYLYYNGMPLRFVKN